MDFVRDTVAPSDFDYVSLVAGATPDRDIWAQANQYPTDPKANRLVLVREAEKIKRWQPLLEWIQHSRLTPTIHLLLVSGEHDLDTEKPHQAAIRDRGYLIRCTSLSEDNAVAWVQGRCEMSQGTARHLLERLGGDLSQAANVCSKLSLFPGEPTRDVVEALCAESPSDDFVDALVRLQKKRALSALEATPHREYSRAVGLLDSRLDVLAKLHTAVRRKVPVREIKGVPVFLAHLLIGAAKHYSPDRVSHCRRVLAVVDDAIQSGVREGPMEALCAVW